MFAIAYKTQQNNNIRPRFDTVPSSQQSDRLPVCQLTEPAADLLKRFCEALALSVGVRIVFVTAFKAGFPAKHNTRKDRQETHQEMIAFAICYRPSVCLSSVCNVRAPYSGGSNFRQCFYGIRYLGHPLTSTKPSAGGVEHKRGSKI